MSDYVIHGFGYDTFHADKTRVIHPMVLQWFSPNVNNQATAKDFAYFA